MISKPRQSVEVLFLDQARSNTEPGPRWHWPLWVLLLMTGIGGLLRFSYLDRPCLWGDESLVYWRICGTYLQMLQPLTTDGFPPLHYELNWLIAHFFKPTPFVLRFVPAICGTLTIPAVYFFARQLVPRSTALVAAAITMCSGFMLNYSRDAKMYADCWLFVTLTCGCMLWWFRRGSFTAWLCWVASGCAACGIHASALAIVAVSPLLLFSQRRMHWRQSLFWLAGAALIFSGPVGYYTKFNTWNERVDERGWRASGITWVEQANRDRTGPDLVKSLATTFAMDWTWPREADVSNITKLSTVGYEGPRRIACMLAVLFGAALLPWPLLLRPRNLRDRSPEPQWRVFLWLSFFILLPAHVFYCRSMPGFFGPVEWGKEALKWVPRWIVNLLQRHHWVWYLLAAEIAILFLAAVKFEISRPTFVRFLKWLLAASVIVGLMWITNTVCSTMATEAMHAGKAWHSIWMPRYLGFIWPAFAIAAAALLMRLPTRPVRMVAVLFLLTVNLASAAMRVFGGTEPPVDQMAKDAWDAQDFAGPVRTYVDMHRYDPNPGGGALFSEPGRYYLQLNAWRQPMTPDRFRASLSEYKFRTGFGTATIENEIRHSPGVKRFVIWEELRPTTLNATDPVPTQLSGWKLASEKWYSVRSNFDWEERYRYRRREYVRVGGKSE